LKSGQFTPLPGTSDIESLYRCLKTLLQVPEDLNRYSSPVAAMDFLVDHFTMFQNYLVEDCRLLYTQLLRLSNHHNRDMSKAGIYAVHKFLDVVSMVLAKSSSGAAEKKTFAVMKVFQPVKCKSMCIN
jgi:DNA-dependent protein kinase catalytic subunit